MALRRAGPTQDTIRRPLISGAGYSSMPNRWEWWRRGESNPCPEDLSHRRLHV